jgi:hypothetical protein
MGGHAEQRAAESWSRYETLTRHIQALDVDIGRELDMERRQVLGERRNELHKERELLVQEMSGLPAPALQDHNADDMEREDLKMLYAMQSDLTVLRREVEELRGILNQVRENCAPVGATLPPAVLMSMIIGGVAMMVVLTLLTLRMGI